MPCCHLLSYLIILFTCICPTNKDDDDDDDDNDDDSNNVRVYRVTGDSVCQLPAMSTSGSVISAVSALCSHYQHNVQHVVQ